MNLSTANSATVVGAFFEKSYAENQPQVLISGKYGYKEIEGTNIVQNADDFHVEFNLDLAIFESGTVEQMFFWIKLPSQNLEPGQFFAWADLPAIKMIKTIAIWTTNGAREPSEVLSPESLLKRLQEDTRFNSKWQSFADAFLGGQHPALNYDSPTQELTVLLPIPTSFLPLDLNYFDASMTSFKIVLTLNPINLFCTRSADVNLNSYVSSERISTPCRLMVLPKFDILKTNIQKTGFTRPKKFDSLIKEVKKFNASPFSHRLPPDVVSQIDYFLVNPQISLDSARSEANFFFSTHCYNAVASFFNSFLRIGLNNPQVIDEQVLINLKSGAVLGTLKASQSFVKQNDSTYIIRDAALKVALNLISASMPWSALAEDIYFDLGYLLKNSLQIDFSIVNRVYFYARLATEDFGKITLIPKSIDIDSRTSFSEGLFVTANQAQNVYGFQKFEYGSNTRLEDVDILKIAISRPIPLNHLNKTHAFVRAKFAQITDPIWQFVDLDRSIKLAPADFTYKYENLEKSSSTVEKRIEKPEELVWNFLNKIVYDFGTNPSTPAFTLRYSQVNSYDGLDIANNLSVEFFFNLAFASAKTNEILKTLSGAFLNSWRDKNEVQVRILSTMTRLVSFSEKGVPSIKRWREDFAQRVEDRFFEVSDQRSFLVAKRGAGECNEAPPTLRKRICSKINNL
jgi:hypothetical protein